MKKYYVIRNGENIAIGCGDSLGGEEITKAEYDELISVIRAKNDYVNKLHAGAITIDKVPAEWQEEIQRRVNDRIKAAADAEAAELEGE
jgi:hypothetical protein